MPLESSKKKQICPLQPPSWAGAPANRSLLAEIVPHWGMLLIHPSVWLPQVSAVWELFHLRDSETAAFTIQGDQIERGELAL